MNEGAQFLLHGQVCQGLAYVVAQNVLGLLLAVARYRVMEMLLP